MKRNRLNRSSWKYARIVQLNTRGPKVKTNPNAKQIKLSICPLSQTNHSRAFKLCAFHNTNAIASDEICRRFRSKVDYLQCGATKSQTKISTSPRSFEIGARFALMLLLRLLLLPAPHLCSVGRCLFASWRVASAWAWLRFT